MKLTFWNVKNFLKILTRRVNDNWQCSNQVQEKNCLCSSLDWPVGQAHDDVVVDAVAQRKVTDRSHRSVDEK